MKGRIFSACFLSYSLYSCFARTTSFPYLYAVPGDPNASAPVIEYLAEEHRDGGPQADFLHSSTYRLVEFYVHYCDVCKNFRPTFMELSRRILQYNDTIEIYAVSCAPNRPLCRRLGVASYPKFRLYPPHDSVGLDLPHSQVRPVTVLQKLGIDLDERDEAELHAEDDAPHRLTIPA